MKKFVFALLATTAILTSSQPAKAAECAAPLATYKYLFSDGNQTYYYNDIYTIREDSSGTRLIQKGDFSYKFSGGKYQRIGNTFTYSDVTGKYTNTAGGPTYFLPTGSYTAYVGALAAGSTYNGETGVYTKQSDGKITFTPKIQKPDVIVSADNCAKIISSAAPKKSSAKNNVVTTTVPAPVHNTVMHSVDGSVTTNATYRNGDEVTTSPTGQIIEKPDGTTIITGPGGTIVDR